MIAIDMDMPRRCSECPLAEALFNNGQVYITCHVTDSKGWMTFHDKSAWCPLIELEPLEDLQAWRMKE